MRYSNAYTILFAGLVCGVCSVFVAGSAVGLAERQEINRRLDRQKKILSVAGLIPEGGDWTAEQIQESFAEQIVPKVIDLQSGSYVDDVDPATFDQRVAARDPKRSRRAPKNMAKVPRLPNRAMIYQVMAGGAVDKIILPVEGKGLWSTLYGFLALSRDLQTIEGLTFYEHGETPGLGGEIDNPRWLALWKGRRPFDDAGHPIIEVVKGAAGSVADDPTHVDGISGATITSRSVTHLLRFWLGDNGFAPYLDILKTKGGQR